MPKISTWPQISAQHSISTAAQTRFDELLKTLVVARRAHFRMARHRRRLGTNLSAIRRKGIDVKLSENPIFITQKRLTHRTGVLAPILIAALIGASLLAGLIAYLADPQNFDFNSPQEAGKTFYGFVMGVGILVLVIGGFSQNYHAIARRRTQSRTLGQQLPHAAETGANHLRLLVRRSVARILHGRYPRRNRTRHLCAGEIAAHALAGNADFDFQHIAVFRIARVARRDGVSKTAGRNPDDRRAFLSLHAVSLHSQSTSSRIFCCPFTASQTFSATETIPTVTGAAGRKFSGFPFRRFF